MTETVYSSLIYPRLKDRVKLRKHKDYVLVYDLKIALHDLIHPSQAIFLALCSGGLSIQQIEYLVGETYRLSPEETKKLIETYLKRSMPFLDLLDNPDPIASIRYDVKQFFYNIDSEKWYSDYDQPVPVPMGINLIPSYKCNFKCRYCYQNVSNHGHEKMDLSTCIRLVQEAAEWGVAYVGLSGGEPTLFDGWTILLKEILKLGMNPVITTNGFVIGNNPDIAKYLKAIGLNEITVSLDASNPKLHHYITRSSNTFSKVIDAIIALIDSDLRVLMKCVLTRDNMEDIGNLIELLVKLGVSEIGISRCEAGAIGSFANLTPPLSSREVDIACENVEAKREKYRGICDIHPPRNIKCQWNENSWYPCGGLYTGMAILPTGKVSVCEKLGEDTPFIYGDVFKNSLREIWNGVDFQRLRDRATDINVVDTKCSQCSKLKLCRTSCFVDSLQACGNYFAKHPLCGGPFKALNGGEKFSEQEANTLGRRQ